MKRVWHILRRLILYTVACVLLSVVGFFAIILGTYGIINAYTAGTATLPADCGIVFGAAVYAQDKPGPAITRRIAAAAELYRTGQVKTLILSGGRGEGVRESEAEVMRTLALQLGVPAEQIIIEDQSHSTWENIAYSKNLTSMCSKVVGISDQYHLARIELLSWRQGWGALQTIPAQDRPPELSEKRSVYREVLALIYYGFYMDIFFPNLPTRAV